MGNCNSIDIVNIDYDEIHNTIEELNNIIEKINPLIENKNDKSLIGYQFVQVDRIYGLTIYKHYDADYDFYKFYININNKYCDLINDCKKFYEKRIYTFYENGKLNEKTKNILTKIVLYGDNFEIVFNITDILVKCSIFIIHNIKLIENIKIKESEEVYMYEFNKI